MSVFLPLKLAAGAAVSDYSLESDYDPDDPTNQSTIIEVTTDNDIERTKLTAVFAGELWFRRTGGDDGHPLGDFLLAMDPKLMAGLSDTASELGDEIASFFLYEQVTVDASVFIPQFANSINEAKKRRQKSKPDDGAIKLADLTSEKIGELFVDGLVSLPVQGGAYIPTVVSAPDGVFSFSFSFCSVPWPDILTPRSAKVRPALAAQSAATLVTWATDPANVNEPMSAYPFASSIPVGYFYSSLPKASFGNAAECEHPLLGELVGDPTGFFASPHNSLRDHLAANVPKWRAFQLVAGHARRHRPSLWPGWVSYAVEVDSHQRPVSPTGRSYARLATGDLDCRVLRQGEPTQFWAYGGDAVSQLEIELGASDYTIPLIVKVADPTFLVRRTLPVEFNGDDAVFGKALPNDDKLDLADQTTPTNLPSDEQDFVHAVFSVSEGSPVFQLCSGEKWHRENGKLIGGGVIYRHDGQWRMGIGDLGSVSPGEVIRAGTNYFKAPAGNRAAWSDSQLSVFASVLDAIAGNEGCLDAINTNDRAFLSAGILQWTIYTGTDHAGELPALLNFVADRKADVFKEYFGRFGLGYADVRTNYSTDLIPRGQISIDGHALTTETQREGMREYRWALLFKVAAGDVAYQQLMIDFVYERLKILRDRTITLSNGASPPISQLFTSQLAVALILDQHTNRPGRVLPNVTEAIAGKLPTQNGAFSEAQLAAIVTKYKNVREMNDKVKRAERIDAAGLSSAPGTFDWPAGAAWTPA